MLSELMRPLKDKAVIGVFVIVAVWNVALSSGWGQQNFPLTLQLKFYDWLWSLRGKPRYDSTVTLVRIDDSLHWAQGRCDSPTSRHLLAQLISNASQPSHKAAVIALDVQLYAPVGKPAGWHNPGREDEDDELLQAIHNAARLGVTIVVPVGFVIDKNEALTRIPNIYADAQLPLADDNGKCGYPACAVLGSIRLPVDKRQIPLQETARDWYPGSQQKQFSSFALAAADAKSRGHVQPSSKPMIEQAIKDHEEVFGGFLPKSAFTKHEISAQQLLGGDDPEMWKKCNGTLMLIGGEWHSDQGYGALEDLHLSPVGELPGLILHANYMEALLGDHFTKSVPVKAAILIDVLIGLVLYVAFHSVKALAGRRRLLTQIAVLLVATIPLVVAYFAFVNFDRYFDFILPTGLYFIHLLYEHFKEYVRLLRRMRSAH